MSHQNKSDSEDSDPVAPPSTPPNAGITLKDVSVTAGKQELLHDVNAEFRPGEITLVVGPSGVGKSILMKIIAGLIGPDTEGIRWSGDVQVDGASASAGRAGVVFQSFALFDEMSPMANMEFAHACGGAHASQVASRDLLKQLRVPSNVPTSRLSGGQRQRLAIARTLAYNPPAILYDEPTSGLDPETGRQVADLIRETHDQFQKTSVVVTHDYHSLMRIADRIFLLDPEQGTLVDVPKDEWESIPEKLAPMATVSNQKHDLIEEQTLSQQIFQSVSEFCASTTGGVISLFVGIFSLIPIWKSPLWGLRFLAHYCRMVFGPTAILYLIASGMIAGFVTTYFTFQFLPYSNYTEPLLIEDLLTALGFAMYRIFVPVLSCVLIAARCGAAVTSDVGGRQFGNQIDAMKTFGAKPNYYLLSCIMWAFLIGTPLLTYASFFAAKYTSLVTFVLTDPAQGPDFWHQHFHRGLILPDQFTYRGIGWLIAKLLTCGVGIAVISYYQGRKPKYSTTDVSRSVTATILWATLLSLFVHYLFALYEYENVVPK
ncbi:MAG: ABC transporter permease [Planctomycetota bacterium]